MNILAPQGPIAAAEKVILIDSIAIMLAIVLPTIFAIFAFAYYFRQSNTRAFYLPDFAHSGRIELVVWSIPTLTIILLGGVAWIGSHQLDPAAPVAGTGSPVRVQVVSLDWKWLFIYPDQRVATVNALTVPVGAPLQLELTSSSVMNAFFIPQLGSMIYTMNAMTTQLNLQADAPGTFPGLSSHYSGDGFSGMHFEVQALPAAEFAAWVAATRNKGPTLDAASYAELSKQSLNTAPFTYGSAAPDLFKQIVSQKLPPGPGPEASAPNRDVSPRTTEP
jgi:cytochrome o ubiquinol oxidase subunit 2